MIGIFDSGSGGLSVLREVLKLLPGEKFVYYADNANCPYGEKTPEFIQSRCRAITEYLLSRGARIIVVACNTATAAAITTLRNEYPVKFIGMEPAVKPAALSSKTGVIGVLATAGTLKGSKYLTTKGIYEDDVEIVEHVGQGFVELVENGILDGAQAEETVRKSLQPLLDAGADRIVLGCTHYPFLRNVIQRIAGPDVQIIDPAPAVAKHLIEVMKEEGLLASDDVASTGSVPHPDIELVTSGDNTSAKRILSMVLKRTRSAKANNNPPAIRQQKKWLRPKHLKIWNQTTESRSKTSPTVQTSTSTRWANPSTRQAERMSSPSSICSTEKPRRTTTGRS